MCQNFLNKFGFKSHLEKESWKLHTEGYSVRETALIILSQGIDISKSQVHRIVSKLEKIMKKGSW